MFQLDSPTPEVLKEVRIIFDEKTNDWMEKGLLDPNYETSYAFWGIIGMAIYSIYHLLMEKYAQLSNSAFFKSPMFGKYKITALDYADGCTLSDFDNPLSDTKKELEERAKYFKEKKLPYAFFYAAAVIAYWLNNKKHSECLQINATTRKKD